MSSPPPSAKTPLLGAEVEEGGTRFGLFARPAAACAVRLFDGAHMVTGQHTMDALGDGAGYFGVHLPGVGAGMLYKFVVDGRELPDPYARFLPQGVHGPAQVMADNFRWGHAPMAPRPLRQHVIYELHVGAFSPEGTYDGVRRRLPYLAKLGVTAIQLMPLAAFPGQRGWGYEGVALYAPFAPYGTPDDLRALVDAAHGAGLAVLLDVVYNHLGPSGNYLRAYSPAYFAPDRRNAWGDALDYRHPVVRRLIIENAVYWLTSFRFDGLRLDATHAILDDSSPSLLQSLAGAVRALGQAKLLCAEDERNDATLVTGHGLDAIWADDFHHQVRVSLTGERDGYFGAYRPGAAELARAINDGWLYQGQVYPPTGRQRGGPAGALEAAAFIYCLQNHDQIGNRAFGDRLNAVVTPAQFRAVSTLLLFLPMTPLLFMGQEWAASSPFLFFTDHDAELGRLIAEGRRREFQAFAAFADPAHRARIPDPQAAETFQASRLRWDERAQGEHARTLALYRALLALRASDPVLRASTRRQLAAQAAGDVLIVRRQAGASTRVLILNLGQTAVERAALPMIPAGATVLLRSEPEGEDTAAVPEHTAIILAA